MGMAHAAWTAAPAAQGIHRLTGRARQGWQLKMQASAVAIWQAAHLGDASAQASGALQAPVAGGDGVLQPPRDGAAADARLHTQVEMRPFACQLRASRQRPCSFLPPVEFA